MPRFNVNSITRVELGVQQRNIILTGKERNPASFCACYVWTGQRMCSPEPFFRGDSFIRLSLRVAVLKADKNGYRRPIYKKTKWRPGCYTSIMETLSQLNYNQWELKEAQKVTERETKRNIKIINKPPPKLNGRPRLDLTDPQKKTRKLLQTKLSVYKKRWEKADNKSNADVANRLAEEIKRLEIILKSQTTPAGGFQHNPLFDPSQVKEILKNNNVK